MRHPRAAHVSAIAALRRAHIAAIHYMQYSSLGTSLCRGSDETGRVFLPYAAALRRRPMQSTTTPVDLNAIEAKARQLRAEAMRDMVVATRAWVAGLFAAKGHGANA